MPLRMPYSYSGHVSASHRHPKYNTFQLRTLEPGDRTAWNVVEDPIQLPNEPWEVFALLERVRDRNLNTVGGSVVGDLCLT